MKAVVLDLKGKKSGDLDLPRVFDSAFEPGLIKRAVLSMESASRQPKGTDSMTGRRNTARYRGKRELPAHERGINVGHARLPRSSERRTRAQGRVLGVPRAVGGPKAHPLKPQEVLWEKINRKERQKALFSAIGATSRRDLVSLRHKLDDSTVLPLVVENAFSDLSKTREVLDAFRNWHVDVDVASAKEKRRRRAGKGKRRGRVHKIKKSLLIVTGKASKVYRAARNLPGVDVCAVDSLNAKLLAPGTIAGRLTIWTKDAIEALARKG